MNEKIRLAQIFEVNNDFIPTKASIYLKRAGNNIRDYFLLSEENLIVDATNFYNINQGINRIILEDTQVGFTGNGYVSLKKSDDLSGSEFSILEYPIKSNREDIFSLYLRGMANSSKYEIDILLDGIVISSIEDRVDSDPSILERWDIFKSIVVIPDTKEHILGIKIKNINNILDRFVFLHGSDINPSDNDIDKILHNEKNSLAPYITVHLQVYKVDNNFNILNKFFIYDFKNSISHVKYDDWYNFNINNLNNNDTSNLNDILDYSEKAALVFSTSGISKNNYVAWELTKNDNGEYLALPSAIKV